MIENIELLAHIRDNISFCRTLVIKYEDLALLDNALIKMSLGIDAGKDKSKWRYYMNLNGEYHTTDVMMVVKSLDDNTMINFTKENLLLHPATKAAYRMGGYYYSRLAAQYSYQRDLINGIINPIPKDEAINARNFKILRYTADYVEWNEVNLIPAMQDFIDGIAYQTFGTEYKYTDDLMYPALLTHLHGTVLNFVHLFRFENRYTRYAHSFYIWSKLQSEGISIEYKNVLNNKQTMWLFRNVEYVLRNLGKEETFTQLMDVLLTEREIPLSKYDMVLDTSDMPVELSAKARYLTQRLNMTDRLGVAETLSKINVTMLKQIPEAIDNQLFYDKMVPITESETESGVATSYPTKILESEMTDTSNRQPETLFHVINSELIYLAKNDLYDIQINFTEQLTGNQYTLGVSDCIVLWHYLLQRWMGKTPVNVTDLQYTKALRVKPPTVAKLMSLGSRPELNNDWCTDLYKSHIPQFRIISPTAFYLNAKAIFDLKWDHKKMLARFPSIAYYSRRANAVSEMYETGIARLGTFKTYPELLAKYGMDFGDYSKDDYVTMMWEIWSKLTGWDQFDHQTIAQVQSGMISLMRFLSSYSVQYIANTEVQDGYFQGGLELMTENPINLRKGGNQIELETEGIRNTIMIHHRAVSEHEVDASYIGTIDELSWKVEFESETHGKVYQTPLLYPSDVADDDSEIKMQGNLSSVLRPGSNPSWEIENLLPSGSKFNNSQSTKGMIIDTMVGKLTEGPWTVVGVSVPLSEVVNSSVARDVSGYSVTPYAKMTTVNGKAQYNFGFTPTQVGKSVVKIDIQLSNTTTGEKTSLRTDYEMNVSQGSWSVILNIPASITLNEEFVISTAFTGLDVKSGERLVVGLTRSAALAPYLTVRSDAAGQLYGKFLKAGWPDVLPVLLTATIYPAGVTDVGAEGVRTRYMIGNVPADRFYDPRTDTDFHPKGVFNEADPSALCFETFQTISEKNGWRVTSVKFADTANNKTLLAAKYGEIDTFLSPLLMRERYVTGTGSSAKANFDWRYGALKLGKSAYDMETIITNITSGETLTISSKFESTAYDHGVKYTMSLEQKGFPISYTINPVYFTISGTTADSEFNMVDYRFNALRPLATGESINIEGRNVEIRGSSLGPFSILADTDLSKDLPIGHVIPVTVKSKVTSNKVTLGAYTQVVLPKTSVFDINSITIADFKLQGWDNEQWAVNSLVFDRILANEGAKGWNIQGVRFAKDSNGNHKTANIRTTLEGPNGNGNIPLDVPTISRRYGSDGGVAIPSTHNLVFGMGYVPKVTGKNTTKLELLITNIYAAVDMAIPFDWVVDVKPATYQMTVDPTTLNPDRHNVNYVLSGTSYPPPASTYYKQNDYPFFANSEAYTNGYIGVVGSLNLFSWPGVSKTPASGKGGINAWLESEYRHNTRDISNSVAYVRKYYIPHNYTESEVGQVIVPEAAAFNIMSLDDESALEVNQMSPMRMLMVSNVNGWSVDDITLAKDDDNTLLNEGEIMTSLMTTSQSADSAVDPLYFKSGGTATSDAGKVLPKGTSVFGIGVVPIKEGELVVKCNLHLKYAPNGDTVAVIPWEFKRDVIPAQTELKLSTDKLYCESSNPVEYCAENSCFDTDDGYVHRCDEMTVMGLCEYNDSEPGCNYNTKCITLGNLSLEGKNPDIEFALKQTYAISGRTEENSVAPLAWEYCYNTITADEISSVGDITLEEMELQLWGTQPVLRERQLNAERYLAKSDVKGWYVDSIRPVNNTNLFERIEGINGVGATLVPTSYCLSGRGQTKDGDDVIPEGFDVIGFGVRPANSGKLDITATVTLKNTIVPGLQKKLPWSYSRTIKTNSSKMDILPNPIIIVQTKELECNVTKTDYSGTGLSVANRVIMNYPGLDAYLTTPYNRDKTGTTLHIGDMVMPSESKGFKVIVLESAEQAGLGAAVSVAYKRDQYLVAEVLPEQIIPIPYPTKESLNVTVIENSWYERTTTSQRLDHVFKDPYGWKVENVDLDIIGTDKESELIYRDIGGHYKARMYTTEANNYFGSIGNQDVPRYSRVQFTPRKQGKQTFTILVTAVHDVYNIRHTFPVDIDVDVQPALYNEFTQTAERWVGLDLTTKIPYDYYTQTKAEAYSTIVEFYPANKKEDGTPWFNVTNTGNQDITVKLLELPEEDGKSMVAQLAIVTRSRDDTSKYSAAIEANKTSYVTMTMNDLHYFTQEQFDIEKTGFKPRLIQTDRVALETQTDAYSYLENAWGYRILSVELVDPNPDEMMGVIDFNGTRTVRYVQSESINNTIKPPLEGDDLPRKEMWLLYGHRKPGTFTHKYRMTWTGTYHNGRVMLDFNITSVVGSSNFGWLMTPAKGTMFVKGEETDSVHTLTGAPRTNMVGTSTLKGENIYVAGEEASKFTTSVTSNHPLTISFDYAGSDTMFSYRPTFKSSESDLYNRTYLMEGVLNTKEIVIDHEAVIPTAGDNWPNLPLNLVVSELYKTITTDPNWKLTGSGVKSTTFSDNYAIKDWNDKNGNVTNINVRMVDDINFILTYGYKAKTNNYPTITMEFELTNKHDSSKVGYITLKKVVNIIETKMDYKLPVDVFMPHVDEKHIIDLRPEDYSYINDDPNATPKDVIKSMNIYDKAGAWEVMVGNENEPSFTTRFNEVFTTVILRGYSSIVLMAGGTKARDPLVSEVLLVNQNRDICTKELRSRNAEGIGDFVTIEQVAGLTIEGNRFVNLNLGTVVSQEYGDHVSSLSGYSHRWKTNNEAWISALGNILLEETDVWKTAPAIIGTPVVKDGVTRTNVGYKGGYAKFGYTANTAHTLYVRKKLISDSINGIGVLERYKDIAVTVNIPAPTFKITPNVTTLTVGKQIDVDVRYTGVDISDNPNSVVRVKVPESSKDYLKVEVVNNRVLVTATAPFNSNRPKTFDLYIELFENGEVTSGYLATLTMVLAN